MNGSLLTTLLPLVLLLGIMYFLLDKASEEERKRK